MAETIRDISTPLARHRAHREEERNRLCPRCGGKTSFFHIMFDTRKFPHLPHSAWVHTCNPCNFMGYLTGDRERDLKARNYREE